ncbi:hypothetical protein [Singulisphaera sp. PoT]|uniref:hypothetical protein n=1 Tax=Singulisphaera sp. PoT TaxID=3411797 RepID=UPI003BF5AAD4
MMVGAFLTLLSSGPIAPSQAMAGCGNHAVSAAERERWLAEPQQQLLSAALSSSVQGWLAEEESLPSPHMPCNGPTCSGKPSKPAMPPVASSVPMAERWCCSSPATSPWRDLKSAALLRGDDFPQPKTRANLIDHPPWVSLFAA